MQRSHVGRLEVILMRKVKIVLLVVVIALVVLFVTQNQPYFQERYRFAFDPFVLEPITLPELPNLVYFCICFGLGALITWLAMLIGRFRMKKELKGLNQTTTSQQVQIDTLNRELAEAKAIPNGIATAKSALGNDLDKEVISPENDLGKDESSPENDVVENANVTDTDHEKEASVPTSKDTV